MNSPIRSLSGIRGLVGDTMTPLEAYKTTLAFYSEYLKKPWKKSHTLIIGRDPKISGEKLLSGALSALKEVSRREKCLIKPVYLGVTSAPMVQWAVLRHKASGGINFTASHNPIEWNGMKLVSGYASHATLLDASRMKKISDKLEELDSRPAGKTKKRFPSSKLKVSGNVRDEFNRDTIDKIKEVIDACSGIKGFGGLVIEEVKRKDFRVVIDACSNSGARVPVSSLLAFGIRAKNILVINDKPIEKSIRPLEPTPQHLGGLITAIKKFRADVGFALDPDQDRLVALPLESEELTPLIAFKFLLQLQKIFRIKYIKKIVVNLSTSAAWESLAKQYGIEIVRTPVGEVNVAKGMLKNNTIAGAEGNGGVILGSVNYGRNSTAGMLLILCYLAWSGKSLRDLSAEIPGYYLLKTKIRTPDPKESLERVRRHFRKNRFDSRDGYKIFLKDGSWVQIRASNTEPILRIFAEARIAGNKNSAVKKAKNIIKYIKTIIYH